MFFFDDRKYRGFRGKSRYPRFGVGRGRRGRPPAFWTGPEATGDTAGMRLGIRHRRRSSWESPLRQLGHALPWRSMKATDLQVFPLISIDFHEFLLIFNDFRWFFDNIDRL